jgi:hypothetical protein
LQKKQGKMDAIPLHPASAASKPQPQPETAEQGPKPLNVLMVGTGEYTTGFVGGGASGSDKKVGVVGLAMFDLRRRGKVGKLSMVGTSGTKYPAIRISPLSSPSLPYSLSTQLIRSDPIQARIYKRTSPTSTTG